MIRYEQRYIYFSDKQSQFINVCNYIFYTNLITVDNFSFQCFAYFNCFNKNSVLCEAVCFISSPIRSVSSFTLYICSIRTSDMCLLANINGGKAIGIIKEKSGSKTLCTNRTDFLHIFAENAPRLQCLLSSRKANKPIRTLARSVFACFISEDVTPLCFYALLNTHIRCNKKVTKEVRKL